ncbi:hypothetical protein ACFLU5_17755 [Bacteroidota bacterium]
MDYVYQADKIAEVMDSPYIMMPCNAVKRKDGKCIRGKNANMLVEFEDGFRVVVLGRRLKKSG